MSLEKDIRELKDRTELTGMMHAYCRHADTLNPAGMAALFTDDCFTDFHSGDEAHVSHSRAAFQAWLEVALSGVVTGSHHISNIEIVFDGPDSAALGSYMYSIQRWEDNPMRADCHRWGRYEIRAVRQSDTWKFSHLRLLSAIEYGGNRIAEHMGRPWPPTFL